MKNKNHRAASFRQNMRRVTLFFLMFCFAIMLTAEPVGKQAAFYTAQSYMLTKGKTIKSDHPAVKSSRRGAAQAADEDAYYYVFDAGDDNGFVIVSGDDRTEPILGYVEHGSYDPDNIPENMRAWLQGYADQIKYIVDNDINPNSPLLKKRNKVQGTRHSVPELLTTRWNQGHPYNLTCPDYYLEEDKYKDTELPLTNFPATGCMATAMAQIMNYHKFPDRILTEIPAYSTTHKSQMYTNIEKEMLYPAIPANAIIDWGNMRDTYNDCTDDHDHTPQEYAVANLMHYCGRAVKMDYGKQSGAYSSELRDAFVNYFGFDDSAFYGYREDFTIDEWFDMLVDEINAGYPLLYGGYSSGGGHAFVLDGFDGDNLFHVNWGWGGKSNGWFLVSILNPYNTSSIGSSSTSDGFCMNQGALFNLRLPDNVTNVKDNPYHAIFIDDVRIVEATKIKAYFRNETDSIYGKLYADIIKLNDDGTFSSVDRVSFNWVYPNHSYSYDFDINGKLTKGTYKLSPAIYNHKTGEWNPKYNMRDEYIEAVVNANGVPTLRINTLIESVSVEAIEFPGNRVKGQEQEVKVTFHNNGTKEYDRKIYLFASTNQTKPEKPACMTQVVADTGETFVTSFFFTPLWADTYNLWFCTGIDGSGQVGTGTMEVIDKSQLPQANLAVTSYIVSNAIGGNAYGNCLRGKANIKNNASEDFKGRINLIVFPNLTSKTYDIEIAAGKVGSFNFVFDNLIEGEEYSFFTSCVSHNATIDEYLRLYNGWEMKSGFFTWKEDGDISIKAYSDNITLSPNVCALYADCDDFTSMTPSNNPNTIYVFREGMAVPASLNGANIVSAGHATEINLVNDKAFYIPEPFKADNATFTYTFPKTEKGIGWHTFTLPFKPTSITLDGTPVSLTNSSNHFWIYEFAATGDDEEIIFSPVTEFSDTIIGATPYIIVADKSMAGRSIVFTASNASFYETGSDKMKTSSHHYKFHGTTLAPKVEGCYVLNAFGTAFEYVTADTIVPAFTSYFTTDLPEGQRISSIMLPEIPFEAQKTLVLNSNFATIPIGETLQLQALATTGNQTFQWYSNKPSVATVDSLGLITAVGEGTTNIIVSSSMAQTVSFTCTAGKNFGTVEGIDKMFDGDTQTKFCNMAGDDCYALITASAPVFVWGYEWTTANDNQVYGRCIREWVLYGTHDVDVAVDPNASGWVTLSNPGENNWIQRKDFLSQRFFCDKGTAGTAYKYFKLVIKKDGFVQASEFRFLYETQRVVEYNWKEGSQPNSAKACDGYPVPKWEGNNLSGNWFTIESADGKAHSIKEYSFTTSDDGSWSNRAPKEWKLEGSNDNSSWVSIDEVTGRDLIANENYQTYTFTPANRTDEFRYVRLTLISTKSEKWAQVGEFHVLSTTDPGDDYVSALVSQENSLCDTCTITVIPKRPGYRYYQFAIEETRSGRDIQLSEFDLLDEEGEEIMPLSMYHCIGSANSGEEQANLFDDNYGTKYSGSFTRGTTLYIYIDAGREVELSGYRLTTADSEYSNPFTWSLYGSNTKSQDANENVWKLLDRRRNDTTLKAVRYKPCDFSIMVLDENTSNFIEGGTYPLITFKRAFAAGWNSVCLPFDIDDVEAFFGTGAMAREFTGYNNGEFEFSDVSSLEAGVPYIVYVPEDITEDFILTDIDVNATASTNVCKNGVFFRGTYNLVAPGEWVKNNLDNVIYYISTDGKICKVDTKTSIKGFSAYFDLPDNITFADANVKAICVSNWDTNDDGELSRSEAAAVTSITKDSGFKSNTTIKSFDELSYFTGLTQIDSRTFDSCSGLTSVCIPSTVTTIGDYAFQGCRGLTSVTLPNGLTNIGNDAFWRCSGLISFTIPESVTSIGSGAFMECSSLTSIDIPNGVTAISRTTFKGCSSLTSITIPEHVTSIGSGAFMECSSLTSVDIPNGVTTIGSYAFQLCSGLTSISIPERVTSIGTYAFQLCSGLTSVTIPNSVISIGNQAFSGCSGLTTIIVEEENTKYDSRNNCNAIIETATNTLLVGCQNTIIPSSVTSIGVWAFWRCSNLTSITIPSSVTSIGNEAFVCGNLTSVTVNIMTPLPIQSNTFSNRANATLYVPAGSKTAYEAADYWKEFKEIIEMESENDDNDNDDIEVTDISQMENAIYIEPFSANPGNTISIDIKLKNSQDVGAYNFDLILPEGVNLEKNAKGKYIYTLAEDRHDEHSCTINEKDGNTYSMAVLSISGGEMTGNDGTVITLQAVLDEDMDESVYPVNIQNARYGLPNGQMVEVAPTQTALTIENVLVADVNGNDGVDIGDAVCIINYIVGKPNAVFVEKAADVNGNGIAGEIGDAVSVVNIIVGKTIMQAPRAIRINMLDPQ